MTNFEHVVLSIVADCLGARIHPDHMEFVEGSLFIGDFTQDEAQRVLNNLQYGGRFGNVEMTRLQDGWVFDFVA